MNGEKLPAMNRAVDSSTARNFLDAIDSRSSESKSRIVLALDLDYNGQNENETLKSALSILELTAKYICAVKINFHLILPLSLSQLGTLNDKLSSYGLTSIADLKLNDIDNTNRIATEYLWKVGFSAVIVNPFAGYAGGLDTVFSRAKQLGKGVITLAYMSHRGASEGFGLKLNDGREVFDLFLERANQWGSDGVVIGSTRPQSIEYAKKKLRSQRIKIFSPGSGAQGGSAAESLAAGADYLIYGRSIISAKDPRLAAREIFEKLAASQGTV